MAPFARDLIPSRNIYLGHRSEALHIDTVGWLLFPGTLFVNGGKPPWLGPFPPLLAVGLPLMFSQRHKADVARPYAVAASWMLGLWILARQGEWLVPRFLLAPTALLLVAAAVVVAAEARKRRWLAGLLLAGTAGLLLYVGLWRHRDWRHHWRFVAGLESRAEWQSRMPHRGYPALHALGPRLGERQKILMGASIYNLPEEKLGWAGTEAQLAGLLKTAPQRREEFLVQHGFAYYYDTALREQEWTAPLAKAYDTGRSSEIMVVRIQCTALAKTCEPLDPAGAGR